jgi:hypothetical protein
VPMRPARTTKLRIARWWTTGALGEPGSVSAGRGNSGETEIGSVTVMNKGYRGVCDRYEFFKVKSLEPMVSGLKGQVRAILPMRWSDARLGSVHE